MTPDQSTLDDIRRRRSEGCSAPADVAHLLSLVDRLREALKNLADKADATGDCDHKRYSCADVGCIGEQVKAAHKALEDSQ